MASVQVDAGICGFSTRITATSEDMQTVQVSFESECPHVLKTREALASVDAYRDLFARPHETAVYAALSAVLPHTACPLYSGFFKAIEVAAGLALPKDVSMRVEL